MEHLESSTKILEDNVAFYEVSETELKNALTGAAKECTALTRLVNDIRA